MRLFVLFSRLINRDTYTELAKQVCPRLCDLATAPAGGITQPRTTFFGQLCRLQWKICSGKTQSEVAQFPPFFEIFVKRERVLTVATKSRLSSFIASKPNPLSSRARYAVRHSSLQQRDATGFFPRVELIYTKLGRNQLHFREPQCRSTLRSTQ